MEIRKKIGYVILAILFIVIYTLVWIVSGYSFILFTLVFLAVALFIGLLLLGILLVL